MISGTPSVVGAYSITVTATNSQGSDTETFSITVSAELTAPNITLISDVTYGYNAALTAIAVTVTGNPTPSISVAGLPAGISYSAGQITGMSTDVGTHGVTVTATNSEGNDEEMFDITIEAELTAPNITAISDVTYAYNVNITDIMVTVTGNPTPSVSVSGLPTGITYENGVISGSSSLADTYEITVTAMNSQGTDTETFDITISAELTVPAITAIGDVTYAYNEAIMTIDVTVTGNPTPSISVAGLPAGITYTGGEITGMSTVAGGSRNYCYGDELTGD